MSVDLFPLYANYPLKR